MSDTLRYPDFICIGAQKAGTTWLSANLSRHPDIWLPAIKEVQYFNELYIAEHASWTAQHRKEHAFGRLKRHFECATDLAMVNWPLVAELAHIVDPVISDEWYGKIFSFAGEHRVSGEMTPEYSLLPPQAIEHIIRLNNNMKFIFMVRDPIDRVWSHLRMQMTHRDSAVDEAELCKMAKWPDVLRRCDYSAILSKWLSKVQSERFLVLNNDDLPVRPTEVLADTCSFLGVEYHQALTKSAGARVHVGVESELPPRLYDQLRTDLRAVYEAPHPLLADAFKPWRGRHYR